MLYNSESGKRIKEPFSHIQWVHKLLIKNGDIKNFNLGQCLFGLHQLSFEPDDKFIAIVESEKTAIIMTGLFPQYIWMATGSLSSINPVLFSPIKKRNIILYPDLNGFSKWEEKANILINCGFKITISDLLKEKATTSQRSKGFDIADYFINSIQKTKIFTPSIKTTTDMKANKVLALTRDDKIFSQMAKINPNLIKLADSLSLVNAKTNKPFLTHII
jgi:hypothetical protein